MDSEKAPDAIKTELVEAFDVLQYDGVTGIRPFLSLIPP